MTARYDALILAGGAGRRLGGVDKALLEVGGRTLLSRVLGALAEAERVVCVGPERATARAGSCAVTWCREEPPGGGPVAAIAAGLQALAAAAVPSLAGGSPVGVLSRADVVVVLSVDLPFVAVGTVHALVGAIGDLDGAVAVDGSGRSQPLLAAYRSAALDARLTAIGSPSGARVRELMAGLRLREVGLAGAADDCDTADALQAARAKLGA